MSVCSVIDNVKRGQYHRHGLFVKEATFGMACNPTRDKLAVCGDEYAAMIDLDQGKNSFCVLKSHLSSFANMEYTKCYNRREQCRHRDGHH